MRKGLWVLPVGVALLVGCASKAPRRWTSEMAISPDQKYAYSCFYAVAGTRAEESSFAVWELERGNLLWADHLTSGSAHAAGVFIGQGDQMVVEVADPQTKLRAFRIVGVQTGKEAQKFPPLSPLHQQFTLTPDGRFILAANSDGTIQSVDIASGKEVAMGPAHPYAVRFLAASADSTLVASCTTGEPIKLWKVPGLEPVRSLGTGKDYGRSRMAFSRDGKLLVVSLPPGYGGGADVEVFDVASGSLLRSFAACPEFISWILFSPDGRRIVAHCTAPKAQYHLARQWDVQSGKEMPTMFKLSGNETGPCTPDLNSFWIDFASDGRGVVLGRSKKKFQDLCLWDLETGELRRTFVRPGESP